jgi:hypothetical protein
MYKAQLDGSWGEVNTKAWCDAIHAIVKLHGFPNRAMSR